MPADMNGTPEPCPTALDVREVARDGGRAWRINDRGDTWRLTRSDLMAIDATWSGDPDDLSPTLAQTIATTLNDRKPWRQPEDPQQPLSWANGIDTTKPSPARVYDVLLGGAHNFAADRQLAEQLIAAEPRAPEFARINRAFLHRAMRFLVAAGVRQFLDLGSGMPTVGNVHQIAQQVDARARVVYVDIDPVAVAHSQLLLADTTDVVAIGADLRDPNHILDCIRDERLLDLSQPVGLLMVAVLHFIADAEDPAGIAAGYRQALCPGSYLVISHACPPPVATPQSDAAVDAYRAASPLTLRRPGKVAALFAGWRLVPPGLVEVSRWRPEAAGVDLPGLVPGVAAVGCLDEAGDRSGRMPGGSDG